MPLSRYEVLGEFMGHISGLGVLGEAANVLEAYLGVLTALAVTQQGAGSMFLQLHRNAPRLLSWQRMLDAMKQYCARYSSHADYKVCCCLS